MHKQADLKTFHITAHDNHLYFLIFSLTETKEKFLPALSSHTEEPCLLLSSNCKARLYQRITWRFRHITPLFNLKISDWLSLSPNRVTYTGTAIPHCASAMPNQTEFTGSHSRKMLLAEIPAPFYLITSGCHASRHNPLLHTFTGNNVIHCRHIFARNGILPPPYPCKSMNG